MRLRKKLPPPPDGEEPIYTSDIQKFVQHDGCRTWLRRPRKEHFMEGAFYVGEIVDQATGDFKANNKTMIPVDTVERTVMMGWAPWRYRWVENPDDPLWSDK